MADISVIITAHREGAITGATANSALVAIEYARAELNLKFEIVVVLDRSDALTEQVLLNGLPETVKVVRSDEGDPGQSRNRGIEAATGACIALLDGDDLWSYNWLAEAWKLLKERPDAIGHSECNVTFGREHNVWWHIDSEGMLFDESYLRWSNYWDSLSFARRETYLEFPFKKNDLARGFGHEDWHWNCLTYFSGVAHKPVKNTIHFKRRRIHSQMSRVAQSDSVVWPLTHSKNGPAAPIHLGVGASFSGVETFIEIAVLNKPILSINTSEFWKFEGANNFRDFIPSSQDGMSLGQRLLNNVADIDDISLQSFKRLFSLSERPTIHFDNAYLYMTEEQINFLYSEMPKTTKVLIFARNPLARIIAEVSAKLFAAGGARGPVTDDMVCDISKQVSAPHLRTAAAVRRWKSIFTDRAKIVWFQENDASLSTDVSEFLEIAANLTTEDDGEGGTNLRPSLTTRQKSILAEAVLRDAFDFDIEFPDECRGWAKDIMETAESVRGQNPCSATGRNFDKLLRWTESLGDNCEFGFVQRYEDYEPSSLFRWTVTPVDKLTEFLISPRELFARENLRVSNSDLVLDIDSGFHFHSELTVMDGDTRRFLTEEEGFSEKYKSEKEKTSYLSEKFFFNIRNNPCIYFYKRNNSVTATEVAGLKAEIEKYNDKHVLVYVTENQQFLFERKSKGLFHATIPNFARYDAANVVNSDGWMQILSALHEQDDVQAILGA